MVDDLFNTVNGEWFPDVLFNERKISGLLMNKVCGCARWQGTAGEATKYWALLEAHTEYFVWLKSRLLGQLTPERAEEGM